MRVTASNYFEIFCKSSFVMEEFEYNSPSFVDFGNVTDTNDGADKIFGRSSFVMEEFEYNSPSFVDFGNVTDNNDGADKIFDAPTSVTTPVKSEHLVEEASGAPVNVTFKSEPFDAMDMDESCNQAMKNLWIATKGSKSASKLFSSHDELQLRNKRKGSPMVEDRARKYISMVEGGQQFKTHTTKYFPSWTQEGKNKKPLTVPKTPLLSCFARARPPTCLSRQQEEEKVLEEMKMNQIKANPLNKKILASPKLGVRVERKPTTVPAPFKLTSVKNKEKCEAEKNLCHIGIPSSRDLEKKRCTEIKPFSFDERDRETVKRKEEKIIKILEEEKKAREFHAKPVSAQVLSPPQPSFVRNLNFSDHTQPIPFNLESEKLRKLKLEQIRQKLEEEERLLQEMAEFKAQPATVIYESPFEPKKSSRPLTKVVPIKLNTEIRAKEREDFDRKRNEMQQKQEEEEIARLRKETVHKALPFKRTKPPVIQSSDKPLTNPIAPNCIKHQYPQSGYDEIEPDELWTKVITVLREAVKASGVLPERISCLGISSQRSSFLTWHRSTGKPFHNFITWKDVRADGLVRQWNHSLTMKGLRAGARCLYTMTRSKRFLAGSVLKLMNAQVTLRLAWVLQNVEPLRRAVETNEVMFGTVDTWLLYKLTGGTLHVTDVSSASATGFFDPFTMQWGYWALKLFNISADMLPEVWDSAADFGCITDDILGAPIPIRSLAPVNNPKASTGFIGIKPNTTRQHMVRAILESIVFRVLQLYKALKVEVKYRYTTIRVDGGVSRNDFVDQLLADLTGLRVERPKSPEISVLGAAFLAGVWKSRDELVALRQIDRVFEPRTEVSDEYNNVLLLWNQALDRFLDWYDV
ncbi:hypothetical protein C0J52_18988 [Blattella germanica]|nr:hypothetical protein C0J52_18988 [Blattella germanica]